MTQLIELVTPSGLRVRLEDPQPFDVFAAGLSLWNPLYVPPKPRKKPRTVSDEQWEKVRHQFEPPSPDPEESQAILEKVLSLLRLKVKRIQENGTDLDLDAGLTLFQQRAADLIWLYEWIIGKHRCDPSKFRKFLKSPQCRLIRSAAKYEGVLRSEYLHMSDPIMATIFDLACIDLDLEEK